MKPATSLLTLFALLVSGFSLAREPDLADDVLEKLRRSERLSPEEARRLVAAENRVQQILPRLFVGLTTLDAATAKVLVEFKGSVFLGGVTTLDAETATVLADSERFSGSLDGLTRLDPATAKVLAKATSGILRLQGLAGLDADTAKALSAFEGRLWLDGLTTLDAATAKALATYKGAHLQLAGLTRLDADVAKELAKSKAWTGGAPRLTSIDAVTATAFAECKARDLRLDGLTRLDVGTARALAEFKGKDLHLDGLTALGADVAKALATFAGDCLYLDGLETLEPDAVTALAGFTGRTLGLAGLRTLDVGTAKAMARLGCESLGLTGLTTLDADVVVALTEYPGHVHIDSALWSTFAKENPLMPKTASAWAVLSGGRLQDVRALTATDSVAIARAFARRKGPLSLPPLKKISPKTLTALLEKKDVEIPLVETLEIIPEPDGSPTEDFVIPDWLEERQKQQRAPDAAE